MGSAMQGEDAEDGTLPAALPRVFMMRGEPVMLAAHVARALGVETREITQAIKRNPLKFTEKHTFQPTGEELEPMRSQFVISGRGWAPTVLTQKGFVRLATVLNSPRAIEATDQIIDLFLSVYVQLRRGQDAVIVDNPSRFTQDSDDVTEIRKLRRRLAKAIGNLLDTEIDAKRKTTVGEALGDTATGLLGHLDAWLGAPKLKNDQIAADTLKVIEQTRDIYERRQADLRRSSAETEKIVLDNVRTKLDIVERIAGMLDKLEPGALAQMLPRFSDRQVSLAAPKAAKRKDDKD